MMMAAKHPACFYGYEEYGFVLYRVDGCEYQDILAQDSIYQRILKLYFDANQMRLIGPDSPNQNYAGVYHKCSAGEILFSPWPWLGKSAYNTMVNRNLGKGNTIIAVGANAKDPGRIAAFIDWLYSPDGIYANSPQPITGTAGPEGLTWQMVFAPDEETFYRLQQELQTAVRSLGYEQVLQKDMENARLQTALRKESATAKAPK